MKRLNVTLAASGEYVSEAMILEHNTAMVQVDGQGRSFIELSVDGEVWSIGKTLRSDNGSQATLVEALAGTHLRVRGEHVTSVLVISSNAGGEGGSGASKAADVELTKVGGLTANNVQTAIEEVMVNVGDAKAIGEDAQAAADAAQESADTAQRTATDAYNTASGLSGQVSQAKADAAAAQAAAVSAGAAAQQVAGDLDKAEARVAALEEKKTVTSTTITAMELITQSAYDTKKAQGELSDTTAYLITE
jgi:hypothetical protein